MSADDARQARLDTGRWVARVRLRVPHRRRPDHVARRRCSRRAGQAARERVASHRSAAALWALPGGRDRRDRDHLSPLATGPPRRARRAREPASSTTTITPSVDAIPCTTVAAHALRPRRHAEPGHCSTLTSTPRCVASSSTLDELRDTSAPARDQGSAGSAVASAQRRRALDPTSRRCPRAFPSDCSPTCSSAKGFRAPLHQYVVRDRPARSSLASTSRIRSDGS